MVEDRTEVPLLIAFADLTRFFVQSQPSETWISPTRSHTPPATYIRLEDPRR